ncbi:MAG: ribosomal RNA small subunit methyltransferase A [Planctomycetaceae bacterium]
MKEAVRQTRSHLLELFSQHGFHPRTDLGQNFLIDLNLVEYIARQASLGRNDVVLEVGAGTGGLTTFLAEKAAAVVSVEVDDNMAGIAKSVVADCDNVTLLTVDALKNKNRISPDVLAVLDEKLLQSRESGVQSPETDGSSALTSDPRPSTLDPRPSRRLKLVANLPYNIATPIVSNLVATEIPWARMVITIQWELALRMTAKPGRKLYGAISVWLQSQCDVEILKKLPPEVFWPRPKVTSAIVRLFPNAEARARIGDRPFFQDFLRRLFHQRRKFARSVLCGMYRKQLTKPDVDAVFAELGIDPESRAEQLNVRTLVELSNRIFAAIRRDDVQTKSAADVHPQL